MNGEKQKSRRDMSPKTHDLAAGSRATPTGDTQSAPAILHLPIRLPESKRKESGK